VGCTAYWDPRPWPGQDRLRAVEIGFTWLAASTQGTGINAEAKLLLLTYAFETLGVSRVDRKTDARNERSRRAIAAAGAHFRGCSAPESQARHTSAPATASWCSCHAQSFNMLT
jgi:RimJ/RimL family protein N-acetyltransferase